MSRSTLRPTLKQLLSNEAAGLTTTIGTAAGLLSVWDWWQKDRTPVYIFGGIILFVILFTFIGGVKAARLAKIKPLPGPKASKQFYPFLHQIGNGSAVAEDGRFIRRQEEVKTFVNIATLAPDRHIVMLGRSGVGKSTLLRSGIVPFLTMRRCIILDEYTNILPELIISIENKISEIFENKYISLSKNTVDCYHKFLSQRLSDAEFRSNIQGYFRTLEETIKLREVNPVFIGFDQSERLFDQLAEFELSSHEAVRRKVTAIGILLEELRVSSFIVTAFAVRSDFTSDCLSRLAGFAGSNATRAPEIAIRCYILNGINFVDSSDVYNTVYTKFLSIDSSIDFPHLERVLALNSADRSNTFLMQLTGYMAEHFANSDARLRRLVRGTSDNTEIVMKSYFEKLSDEYALTSTSNESRRTLDITLFTIAIEGYNSGQPLAVTEVCQLAHIPVAEAEECMTFLASKGVIVRSSKDDEPAYRLAHDRIVEYVINSDDLSIRRDHREAISLLSKSNVSMDEMIVPDEHVSVYNLVAGGGPNIPQILLLLMQAFCLFRLILPEAAFKILAYPNQIIDAALPGAIQTFDFRPELYIPIMITQFVWVNFMYYLDASYFHYVLANRSPFLSLFSKSIAPIGGLAGCILAFAPGLFLVPIIIGGTGLAALYFFHAQTEFVKGLAKANSLELSAKTAFNMVLSIGFTLILYLQLFSAERAGSKLQAFLAIAFFAVGFIWYWVAMKPRQGSLQGWSTLLCLFDRGRTAALSR